MSVTVHEYERALNALEKSLALPLDDIVRDACLERFELCVELAWKTARKVMGTQSTAPRQVVREIAKNGSIEDVQIWFDALEKRNLTSYTYNESVAFEVYQFVELVAPEFRNLLIQLKR